MCNCVNSLDVVICDGLIVCSGIHWQFNCFVVERLGMIKRIDSLWCAHGVLVVHMWEDGFRGVVEGFFVEETGSDQAAWAPVMI